MAASDTKSNGSVTNRRRPTQSRSREKVNKILESVKALIAENGLVNLKIGEIAKHAGVAPSSIYQYFSDKETIIIALAEQYMEQIRALIEKNLDRLEHHEQIAEVIRANFHEIYNLHLSEPALTQIWFESNDPRMNQLAFEDTQHNASLIMERVTPLVDPNRVEKLSEFVLLVSHQFAATMRLNIVSDHKYGTDFIDMHIKMIESCLDEYVGVKSF